MSLPRASEPRPAAGGDWVRDALARASDEIRAYGRSGIGFTLHPGRFAVDWLKGTSGALNPLAMLATGAGVLSVSRSLLFAVIALPSGERGFLEGIRDGVAPFVHYAFLGAVCHLILRARSTRRLTDSLAMSLFAGGGPGVASTLAVYAAGLAVWMAAGRPDVRHQGLIGSLPAPEARALLWVAYAGYAVFLAGLLFSLAALHRVSIWRSALALAIAMFVTGVLFGLKPADIPFGTRVLVRFNPLHASIWVD